MTKKTATNKSNGLTLVKDVPGVFVSKSPCIVVEGLREGEQKSRQEIFKLERGEGEWWDVKIYPNSDDHRYITLRIRDGELNLNGYDGLIIKPNAGNDINISFTR